MKHKKQYLNQKNQTTGYLPYFLDKKYAIIYILKSYWSF